MEKEKKEKVEKEVKEEKTEREEKLERKSSVQTTLIVFLLICTAALGGWVVGASKVAISVQSSAERNNKTSETKTDKSKTDTKKETANNDNTDSTEKEDAIKPVDITKNINNNGREYDTPSEITAKAEYIGLSVTKVDDRTAKINYDNADAFCKVYMKDDCASITSRGSEEVKFDKDLDKVFIGGEGQDSTGAIIFYLMKDGTVQYFKVTNRSNALRYNDISNKTEGTVPGATGVVNLYMSGVIVRPVGSYITTIGATKDGSFYDLADLINQ